MLNKIKNIISNIPVNIYRKYFSNTTNESMYKDRLDFDADIHQQLVEQHNKREILPKISAVIRVKNGSEYIEASILSIVPIVSEVVIVDNNSTDNTIEIVEKLANELKGICDFNISSYDSIIEFAGKGYSERLKNNPNGSLAKFYNYSFSLAKHEYVMKWDAHAIMFDKANHEIQNKIKNKPDAISFRALEFYGKSMNEELRIYNKDIGIDYIDGDDYELLSFNKIGQESLRVKKIKIPAYYHIKRLSYNKLLRVNNNNIIEEKYK